MSLGSISPQERRRDSSGSTLLVLGQVFVAAGLTLLLFVAFEVVGTALIQQRHQAELRSHLLPVLHDPSETRAVGGPLATAPPHPAPPAGTPVAIISIPRIGLDMVVVEGTSQASLELGPGHYERTPLPGGAGNVAIAGHRTTWARPFYNLDQLRPGDPITLTSPQGTFTYRTRASKVVDPSDVDELAPTAHPTLTLTTCNPRFSASQRLVVEARLVRSSLTPSALVTFPSPRSEVTTLVPSSPVPAILLGLLSLLLVGGTIAVATRSTRRWVVWTTGGVLSMIALLATFFVASPLLPANL